MPNLTDIRNFLVVGAIYVDLDYEIPSEAFKTDADTQLFCEASFRIGGTGFNQANILSESTGATQNVKLVTILGNDPASELIKKLLDDHDGRFSVEVLDVQAEASPPIVSILHETIQSRSRRLMIGPPRRYISNVWSKLPELNTDVVIDGDCALLFDGYSLTDYDLTCASDLSALTSKFVSSTLLLLPHKIYQFLRKDEFLSALKCFNNLESSFYTVSRILFGLGDIGIPGDALIAKTVAQLVADCAECELNLRFGALDAQYCAHYRGGGKISIIEYDIDRLGNRSVGDHLQVREMVDPSALREKHRREISIF